MAYKSGMTIQMTQYKLIVLPEHISTNSSQILDRKREEKTAAQHMKLTWSEKSQLY